MKEVNINYYQQLLDKGRLNPSDRDFYQKVLNSVKKQGGKATERQYNVLQQIKFGKTSYSSKNEHIYNKKSYIMNTTSLRQLIKESIQEYIREIDEAGNRAALEAKIAKTQEAIDLRKKKLNMEGLDEAYHDMMDKGKMKEMTSEIKLLEKSLAKYGKSLEKMDAKDTPKMEETQDTDVEEEMLDEVDLDEYTADPSAGPELEEDSLNEEQVLYMQKMAGIISEREYNEKLEEAKKKPSSGLTKKQKSAVSKKAHKGEDIGKKGKGFEKVAKAGEKQYGSKEAGEKVAAAAMWKSAAKKAKSLKEEIKALFEGEMLDETKIPFFRLQQVLKNEIDKPNPQDQADLKVGLNYVIPKKHYSNMDDVRQHIGKVTKIEGDKVFIETSKGEERQYKTSDLIHIINAGS